MKNRIFKRIPNLKSLFIILLISGLPFVSMGQDPPDPGGCPQTGPTVGPGGPLASPIEDDVLLIIGFAVLYGGYQFFKVRKRLNIFDNQ